MSDEQSRQIMMGIADDYERMARLAEERVKKRKQQNPE
jgi:hypothetical protein